MKSEIVKEKSSIKIIPLIIAVYSALFALIYFALLFQASFSYYKNPPQVLLLIQFLLILGSVFLFSFIALTLIQTSYRKHSGIFFVIGISVLISVYFINLFANITDLIHPRYHAYFEAFTQIFIPSVWLMVSIIFMVLLIEYRRSLSKYLKKWKQSKVKEKPKKTPEKKPVQPIIISKTTEPAETKRPIIKKKETLPKPSKIEYIILDLIYSGMDSIDLFQKETALSRKDITDILMIMQKRGWIVEENTKYRLTKKGFEIVEELEYLKLKEEPTTIHYTATKISAIMNTIGLFLLMTSFMFPLIGKSPLTQEIYLIDLLKTDFVVKLFVLSIVLIFIGYFYPEFSSFAGVILLFFSLMLSSISRIPVILSVKIQLYNTGFYILLLATFIFLMTGFARQKKRALNESSQEG